MLVEYVKDNYYARFHGPSYHRYREDTLVFYLTQNYDKVNGA